MKGHIALQTDPPLYPARRTADELDFYYDLVDTPFAQAIYPEDTRYTPYNRTNYRDTEYDENVQTLLSWLTGDMAQRLLEASGYVGLK